MALANLQLWQNPRLAVGSAARAFLVRIERQIVTFIARNVILTQAKDLAKGAYMLPFNQISLPGSFAYALSSVYVLLKRQKRT
jgi:hypothetical protein